MITDITTSYKNWLIEIKEWIRISQIKAAVSVNRELLALYWSLGEDIAQKQTDSTYGSGFFDKLSRDLKEEFHEMKGFSPRNLRDCTTISKDEIYIQWR